MVVWRFITIRLKVYYLDIQKGNKNTLGPGSYYPKLYTSSIGWTQSKDERISTFIKEGLGAPVGSY